MKMGDGNAYRGLDKECTTRMLVRGASERKGRMREGFGKSIVEVKRVGDGECSGFVREEGFRV